MTMVQMVHEYLFVRNDIKVNLEKMQLIFESNLVNALWTCDANQILTNEEGIMHVPTLVGMQIYDSAQNKYVSRSGFILNHNNEIVHSKGEKTAFYLSLIQHKFNLMENGKKIGEAVFYSSNKVIFNKIKYTFLIIIISAIIKTAILWGLFLWTFNKYMTSPLDIFCNAMENIDIDKQNNNPLSFETFSIDELSRLEHVFNKMLRRITDSRNKLDILNKTLEKEVDLRTRELKETNQKLEKYVNQIEEIAITDELTKLYNRRYFNEIFPKEIQRAVRGKQAISFLMIDVDYFKLYNDNYGHQKGDEVLAAIGNVLKRNCCRRASDIPVRLGGEEFGVIFSKADAQQSAAFSESVRDSVESLRIEHAFNKAAGHISVSCGLLTVINPTQKTYMDELYKIADKALYSAKENGRNQVKQIIL